MCRLSAIALDVIALIGIPSSMSHMQFFCTSPPFFVVFSHALACRPGHVFPTCGLGQQQVAFKDELELFAFCGQIHLRG
jgi:hypothetical protein